MPVTPVSAPTLEIFSAVDASWKVELALPTDVPAAPLVLMFVAPVTVRLLSVPTPVMFVNEPVVRSMLAIVPSAILLLLTAPVAIVATPAELSVTSLLMLWLTQALPLYISKLPAAGDVIVNVLPCSLAIVGFG